MLNNCLETTNLLLSRIPDQLATCIQTYIHTWLCLLTHVDGSQQKADVDLLIYLVQ